MMDFPYLDPHASTACMAASSQQCLPLIHEESIINSMAPYDDPYNPEAYDPSYYYLEDALNLPPQSQVPYHPMNDTSFPTTLQQVESSGSTSFQAEPTRQLQDPSSSSNSNNSSNSSSEEPEPQPQTEDRRREQNRAAQRAFRERKERHVKTLEEKLASLAAHSSTLASTNERLQLELQKLSTQNEILRATSAQFPAAPQHPSLSSPSPLLQQSSPYPLRTFTPTPQTSSQPIHRLHKSAATGDKLLSAGQTWDLIQSIESVKKGRVDVGDVFARLKRNVICDGSGPAFAEGEIRRAVEESVGGGGDELI